MKKLLQPHQLETLAHIFVEDFCAKNQINFAPAKDADALSADSARWETGMIAPTGNMSGMIREVEIAFEVFNTNEETPELFSARVIWSYNHPDGSSNGKSVNYIILASPGVRKLLPPEYEGYCEDGLIYKFAAVYNRQKNQ